MARFITTGGSGEGTPGAPGADGADGQDGAQGEIGFPGFKYDTRRVFANQYVVGEIVEYDGDYFICIANNDAITPAVGDYWASYSFVGPQGEPGEQGEQGSAGLVYLGNYVSGNGYTANLAVVKGNDNNLYIATSSGGLGDPVGNSVEWDIFLPKGEDGEDAASVTETSFTVNGGTLETQPTFDGAPLFSGTYVKTGPMVHFQVQVDMDNILTFGTGQYFIDLPFPSKYGYQVRSGCLHDISTDKQYAIGGHVFEGQSQLTLTFTNSSGQDEAFDHNSPVTLNVADNFHISGTYICQ
jgi:hypothetical protein